MHRPVVVFIVIMDVQTYLIYFCYGCKQLSYICHIYVCFQLFGYLMIVVLSLDNTETI
ncbi:hypothetical protein Hanom_Chr12g01128921 [Helianthus anomalus]